MVEQLNCNYRKQYYLSVFEPKAVSLSQIWEENFLKFKQQIVVRTFSSDKSRIVLKLENPLDFWGFTSCLLSTCAVCIDSLYVHFLVVVPNSLSAVCLS